MNAKDLKALLDATKTERPSVDYKERFNWATASKDEKAEIVKDLLAMANTKGGGKVVLGVRDGDFKPVGLELQEFQSFDQTKVNDFLHRYTDPRFSCLVHKLPVDERLHVVLEVPEFIEIPIICRENFNSTKDNKLILKRGGLYVRTEKATSELVSSSEEMRGLIELAVMKKENRFREMIVALLRPTPPEKSLGRRDEPVKASAIPNPVDPSRIR
ncbi:MAG TPA: ATP-binding protein [Terriglobia bacterium]|nr:ATP-binding protein [Terriglobia bacterium]